MKALTDNKEEEEDEEDEGKRRETLKVKEDQTEIHKERRAMGGLSG